LVKLIETDVKLEQELEEFEGSFEIDELKKNMIITYCNPFLHQSNIPNLYLNVLVLYFKTYNEVFRYWAQ